MGGAPLDGVSRLARGQGGPSSRIGCRMTTGAGLGDVAGLARTTAKPGESNALISQDTLHGTRESPPGVPLSSEL